jgi:hypothetical protein
MGSGASPITFTLKIEDRGPLEYLLDSARDQNAGGGRMNWVMAGQKIRETSETGLARAVVTKTGADATVWVLIPT